jgi:hypothetical protein
MYEVFDGFLESHKWFSGHPDDERRFFIALNKIIRNDQFDPVAMGDYMREKLKAKPDTTIDLDLHVTGLVNQAAAIKDFLMAIEPVPPAPHS